MATLKELFEGHLEHTHLTRVANFRQFQRMLEKVDATNADMTATRVATLSLRISQLLRDMASLRDPTAYVQAGYVLRSLKPGAGDTGPIMLVTDKQRLEEALQAVELWDSRGKLFEALYQLLEMVSQDDRLAGLVWMGFASMHPSVDALNVFRTEEFAAVSPDDIVPATRLEMAAIGHMTRELRRLVP